MNVYEHFTLSLSNDCRQEGTKGLPENTEKLRQGAESVFLFLPLQADCGSIRT